MDGTTFFTRCFQKAFMLVMLALLLVALPASAQPVRAQRDPTLFFIENVGQFPNEGIHFQVNMGQLTLSLAEDALWLTILEQPQIDSLADPAKAQSDAGRGVNLKVTFGDANPAPQLEPFNRLDSSISYFAGRDPTNWQTDVPVWGGVRYVELYPGIDLEITGEYGQILPRLVIKDETVAAELSAGGGVSTAGLSPLAKVRLKIEGAEAIVLSDQGRLQLTTALGDVTLPLLQITAPDGTVVNMSAAIPEIQGLDVAAPFTVAPPPAGISDQAGIAAAGDLAYSTFIGGNAYFDSSQDIAIDEAGYAYITGRAYTGFPTTPGVFDPTIEGYFNDAFVAKLSPDGSSLVYATLLGGNAYAETGYAIAVDEAGNAYVTGFTVSADFPVTPGAFADSLASVQDIFVAKLNSTGTGLLYATLLGGNGDEHGYDIAVDGAGQAFVTGSTRSTDFPTTPDAFAPVYNGGFADGFVAKVTADGSDLIYATYVGGSADESSDGIAIDETGSAYLTGYTSSTDFPTTPGAWDTSMAVADAFVVKLNSVGSDLIYSTLLGGSQAEVGRAIALDEAGSAFITGRTDSRDFPATPDAFDTSYNSAGNDAFVAKLSPDGNGLFYATYLGGNNEEEGRDLAVDATGSAYVTGYTYASDFPTTPDALSSSCQGCTQKLDAFIAKINPNGTGLIYGSYMGGSEHDRGYGLAQDGMGYVYLAGDTQSPDFPTTSGAYDTSLGGFGKGFVAKLFVGTELGPPRPPLPDHSCAPALLDTFTVQSEPRGLALDPERQRLYVANFGSGSVSVVDTTNDNVLQTIPNIDTANGVAYDPSQNLIWVSNYKANQITPIQANEDATSFTVLPPLPVGAGPWGVAYDPVHNYVYVANSLDSSVSVIDAGTQTLLATLGGSFNQPHHLVVNPIAGKVYVANSGHNSVTVVEGTAVSKEVQLWDSGRAYGLAVDETRNLVYVATVQTNRIVAIGPLNGQPDQFLGWVSFQRGYNPNRRVPLRAIAVNPALGPVFDGGHVWTTTATGDGSEQDQVLLIPKGWSSRFHVPFAQNVGNNPGEGLAIDRTTNRVYISSGNSLGLVTVIGDHVAVCGDVAPADASGESDQITFDIYTAEALTLSDVNRDGRIDILDLVRVASAYGGSDSAADVNGDGTVDILDLTIVASHYGRQLLETEE